MQDVVSGGGFVSLDLLGPMIPVPLSSKVVWLFFFYSLSIFTFYEPLYTTQCLTVPLVIAAPLVHALRLTRYLAAVFSVFFAVLCSWLSSFGEVPLQQGLIASAAMATHFIYLGDMGAYVIGVALPVSFLASIISDCSYAAFVMYLAIAVVLIVFTLYRIVINNLAVFLSGKIAAIQTILTNNQSAFLVELLAAQPHDKNIPRSFLEYFKLFGQGRAPSVGYPCNIMIELASFVELSTDWYTQDLFFPEVPMLQIDLVGFSRLCTLVSPIDVASAMSDLFSILSSFALDFDLRIVASAGDAVFVVPIEALNCHMLSDPQFQRTIDRLLVFAAKATIAVRCAAGFANAPFQIRSGLCIGSLFIFAISDEEGFQIKQPNLVFVGGSAFALAESTQHVAKPHSVSHSLVLHHSLLKHIAPSLQSCLHPVDVSLTDFFYLDEFPLLFSRRIQEISNREPRLQPFSEIAAAFTMIHEEDVVRLVSSDHCTANCVVESAGLFQLPTLDCWTTSSAAFTPAFRCTSFLILFAPYASAVTAIVAENSPIDSFSRSFLIVICTISYCDHVLYILNYASIEQPLSPNSRSRIHFWDQNLATIAMFLISAVDHSTYYFIMLVFIFEHFLTYSMISLSLSQKYKFYFVQWVLQFPLFLVNSHPVHSLSLLLFLTIVTNIYREAYLVDVADSNNRHTVEIGRHLRAIHRVVPLPLGYTFHHYPSGLMSFIQYVPPDTMSAEQLAKIVHCSAALFSFANKRFPTVHKLKVINCHVLLFSTGQIPDSLQPAPNGQLYLFTARVYRCAAIYEMFAATILLRCCLAAASAFVMESRPGLQLRSATSCGSIVTGFIGTSFDVEGPACNVCSRLLSQAADNNLSLVTYTLFAEYYRLIRDLKHSFTTADSAELVEMRSICRSFNLNHRFFEGSSEYVMLGFNLPAINQVGPVETSMARNIGQISYVEIGFEVDTYLLLDDYKGPQFCSFHHRCNQCRICPQSITVSAEDIEEAARGIG